MSQTTRSTLPGLALASLAALPLARPQDPDGSPAAPAPVTDLPVFVQAVHADVLVELPKLTVTWKVTLLNVNEVETDYELIFPLGGPGSEPVVTGLSTRSGAEELEGVVLPVDEARAMFRELAEERDEPALLEHYGRSVYRATVPVVAGSNRELTIRYEQLVEPDGEALAPALPLTTFRRSAAPVQLTIAGELRAAHPIGTFYSPTHPLRIDERWETWSQDGEPTYHARFRVDDPASACDVDFRALVQARPDGGRFDVALLSERPDPNEPGYFLAVVNGIPDETLQPEPKNVVFVLDRSGSMGDGKLDQARAALKYLVGKLRPEDRFGVVDYSVGADLFTDVLQGATPAVRESVYAHLDGLVADGNTNIEAALTTALALFHDPAQMNQIVFLTDGLPTEGTTEERALAKVVADANTTGTRIIAFGVGYDVNSALLDRLAADSRGLSEYVLPGEDIDAKVPQFYAQMHAPLLLDAELGFEGSDGIVVEELFPAGIGDVYGGQQVVVTGRYDTPGPIQLVLSGRRGQAHEEHAFDFHLADAAHRSQADMVARIWAAKKIGFLVDDIRLNGESDEKIAAIVELGTRFGILTEYTAFLTSNDTDLYSFAENALACSTLIEEGTAVVTGSHGVAQACNPKALQRQDWGVTSNRWYGADGEQVTVGGVQCVAGRTLFQRDGRWIDMRFAQVNPATAPESPAAGEGGEATEPEPAELVALYSPEFYALLDEHTWLGCTVARTGDLTVSIDGKRLRLAKG